jgi:phosphate transport system protein
MKKFENELNQLQQRLAEMGELVRRMTQSIAGQIQDRSKDCLPELKSLEKRVNAMQVSIDQDAVRMLTVYGPVAKDLRFLLVVTHMTAQLERIGDQVMNVTEALNLMTTDPATHATLPKLKRMADLVNQMIDDALNSYFNLDADKAAATRGHDDMVDALNDQVMKELLTIEVLQEVLSGAKDIADAVAQILIARYLERMADQATNICKEVVYLVKGDDVRHMSSRQPDDGELFGPTN